MKSLSPSTRYKQKACSDLDSIVVQSVVCEMYPSRESPLLNRGFEKLLLDAVDEGFACLGESVGRTIYYHLENDFNIKRQDIPCKIEGFADAIEKVFGTGAGLLEIEIMKRLHEKVGGSFRYFPEQKNLAFTEYVKTVKLLYIMELIY
jgi:hypothetical protein